MHARKILPVANRAVRQTFPSPECRFISALNSALKLSSRYVLSTPLRFDSWTHECSANRQEIALDSGYYAACAAFRSQSQALELIAHNLANVNSAGYRAQQTSFRSLLSAATARPINVLNQAVNNFNVLGSSELDLSSGNVTATGNPFDLAIEGGGFFVLQNPAGTFYTRDGEFHVSPTGELVSSDGDSVMGEQGPVKVPQGVASISTDGTLSVAGAVAGKLRIVEFAPGSPLVSAGKSRYSAPDGVPAPAARSYVRQGMIESSNVNPIAETISLITAQRQAEMMQRAMSVFYGEFNRIAATELPRV